MMAISELSLIIEFSETGNWVFENDKIQVNLTGVGSIELTNQTSTVSSSYYTIIRLKNHELWYYYENGGARHEFHLIK
jgi:phytoene dehydrogenase-like protein